MKLKINILKIVFAILAISNSAFSAKKQVVQKKGSFASKIKLLKKHQRPILATAGVLAVSVVGSVLLYLGLKPKKPKPPVQIRSQKLLLSQKILAAESAKEAANILANEMELDDAKKTRLQQLTETIPAQTYKTIILNNIYEYEIRGSDNIPALGMSISSIDVIIKELEEASTPIVNQQLNRSLSNNISSKQPANQPQNENNSFPPQQLKTPTNLKAQQKHKKKVRFSEEAHIIHEFNDVDTEEGFSPQTKLLEQQCCETKVKTDLITAGFVKNLKATISKKMNVTILDSDKSTEEIAEVNQTIENGVGKLIHIPTAKNDNLYLQIRYFQDAFLFECGIYEVTQEKADTSATLSKAYFDGKHFQFDSIENGGFAEFQQLKTRWADARKNSTAKAAPSSGY